MNQPPIPRIRPPAGPVIKLMSEIASALPLEQRTIIYQLSAEERQRIYDAGFPEAAAQIVIKEWQARHNKKLEKLDSIKRAVALREDKAKRGVKE